MKIAAAAVALLVVIGLVATRGPLEARQAEDMARQLAEAAKAVADAPVKADVEPGKSVGIRAGPRGLVVIPARRLSAGRLARAGTEIVPVGQLWLRGLTPVVDGRGVGRDKVRRLPVTFKKETHRLAFLVLGARRRDGGDWELLVYGKGREPLARLPMKAVDSRVQLQPIEVDGKANADHTGDVTFRIVGEYEAVLVLGEAAE